MTPYGLPELAASQARPCASVLQGSCQSSFSCLGKEMPSPHIKIPVSAREALAPHARETEGYFDMRILEMKSVVEERSQLYIRGVYSILFNDINVLTTSADTRIVYICPLWIHDSCIFTPFKYTI